MERLTPREGRVVASLVEKQLTIPQHYPLTLHALVAACNQSSSRDPVTALSAEEVLEAVEALKGKRLVRAVLPSHGRSVVRYRHVMDEALGLDGPQLAVLAVLELRGPQTTSELRARTERMAAVESVDHEIDLLASRDDPLAGRVARRPGQKEDRWASLLSEPPSPANRTFIPAAPGADVRDVTAPAAHGPVHGHEAVTLEPDALRAEVDGLRNEVDAVKRELETLRTGLTALRSGLDELRRSLGD